jgi:hypothetical protein
MIHNRRAYFRVGSFCLRYCNYSNKLLILFKPYHQSQWQHATSVVGMVLTTDAQYRPVMPAPFITTVSAIRQAQELILG